MQTIINTKVLENRGSPRIWLEGVKLEHAFTIGSSLSAEYNEDEKTLELFENSVNPNTKLSVSKRTRREKIVPLIEFKDEKLAEFFGVGASLRISISNGKAKIEALGLSKEQNKRVADFTKKVIGNKPLSIGSVFSGGGILDAAFKEGLKKAGFNAETSLIIEESGKYIDSYLKNQPENISKDACIIESKVEFVDLPDNLEIDILVAGMPCTAASKAGATKNKLKSKGGAEFHDSAGACFFYWLNFIKVLQPVSLIMECVPEYLNTTSFAIIKSVLETWNYDLSVEVLNGNEFGALESRDRMCLVANTKGLKGSLFSFESVKPLSEKPESIESCLVELPLDDKRWKSYDYLKTKEIRDQADGKGFKRDLYNGKEDKVKTIRRLYHKGGSCDQYLVHPTNPELSRLFTPVEHARFKKIPEKLISGLADTTAHEILGQSVVYSAFESVGAGFGSWLKCA